MSSWIPFLHAVLFCGFAFVLLLLDVYLDEVQTRTEFRRMKLRDKLYRAMSQSPKRRAV